jgi:hypothetical protein
VNLRPTQQHSNGTFLQEATDPSTSILFRLVDVAARTFEAASPPEGHLARRYAPLLRGMTDLIVSSSTQTQVQAQLQGVGNTSAVMPDTNLGPEFQSHHLGDDLWEMWQQAGLEPMIWSNILDDNQLGLS